MKISIIAVGSKPWFSPKYTRNFTYHVSFVFQGPILDLKAWYRVSGLPIGIPHFICDIIYVTYHMCHIIWLICFHTFIEVYHVCLWNNSGFFIYQPNEYFQIFLKLRISIASWRKNIREIVISTRLFFENKGLHVQYESYCMMNSYKKLQHYFWHLFKYVTLADT